MKSLLLNINQSIPSTYYPHIAKLGTIDLSASTATTKTEKKVEIITKLAEKDFNSVKVVAVAKNDSIYILPIKVQKSNPGDVITAYKNIPAEVRNKNVSTYVAGAKHPELTNISSPHPELITKFWQEQFEGVTTVTPVAKLNTLSFTNLVKMAENSEEEQVPPVQEGDNVSEASDEPQEFDWSEDPEIKSEYGFQTEQINLANNSERNNSQKIKRPLYNPKENGPIVNWFDSEVLFLDYNMLNERTIVSSVLNSLPQLIANNVLNYLKTKGITRESLTVKILKTAIKESNMDTSKEYANSYKSLKFNAIRHGDMKSYYEELKKLVQMSIKEKLSEESYHMMIIPFFRNGIPQSVKKMAMFQYFPDDDPEALINLAQKMWTKQREDETTDNLTTSR